MIAPWVALIAATYTLAYQVGYRVALRRKIVALLSDESLEATVTEFSTRHYRGEHDGPEEPAGEDL